MKKLLSILLVSVFLFSCGTTSRYGTEGYIKNNIQQHKVNEFSEIQTYSIGMGQLLGIEGKGGGFIEFVGYKYDNNVGLVISSDKSGIQNNEGVIEFNGKTKFYNVLSLKNCKDILKNYKILIKKGDESYDKRERDNTFYFDYSVNKDVYLSIEHVNKGYSEYRDMLHFWIDGQKYSLSSNEVINNIRSFINWVEK
tara:strand:+ start:396 stop:983 length:588 start_codon:yes stop_codon:yes gene_type:complete